MKLITETNELSKNFEVKVITEASGDRRYYITGPFAVAEQINKNGRIYEERILSKAVSDYDTNFITQNRAFGEFGHPAGPAINGDRICIRVVEMKKSGNIYEGKAQVSSTPLGKIVCGLIDDGGVLGVSTRGMGSLREQNGINYVQPDYYLAAVDVVTDPSGPNCFVNGVMENTEWVYDETYGWQTLELAEQLKKTMHKNWKKIDEAAAMRAFERFLSTL